MVYAVALPVRTPLIMRRSSGAAVDQRDSSALAAFSSFVRLSAHAT